MEKFFKGSLLYEESEGHIMDEFNEYLAHYGVKNQKWGVRRYQNPDGSLTEEGKARRRKTSNTKNIIKKAQEKRASKKAAQKAEDKVQKHENLKKYVREHPKKLYKHRAEFTNEEINKIISDIEFDRKIKDVRNAEIQRGFNKLQTISNNVGTVSNFLNNSINTYNNVAKINNLLVDTGHYKGGKRMTLVGSNPPNDQSDKDKKKSNN